MHGVYDMTALDFSRFDPLPAPVALVAEDLRLLYCNPEARRRYPLIFPVEDMTQFYFDASLSALEQAFSEGRACRRRFDRGVPATALFEPVFSAEGKFAYAFVWLEDCASDLERVLHRFSDRVLLNALREEWLRPLSAALGSLQLIARSDIPGKTKESLESVRRQLLRMSVFAVKMDHLSEPEFRSETECCDLNEILSHLASKVKLLQYTVGAPVLIPVDPRNMHLILLDILIAMISCGDRKGKIHVSLSATSEVVKLRFSAEKPAAEIQRTLGSADPECANPDVYLFRRRLERCCGSVTVRASSGERGAYVDFVCPGISAFSGSVCVHAPDLLTDLQEARILVEYINSVLLF